MATIQQHFFNAVFLQAKTNDFISFIFSNLGFVIVCTVAIFLVLFFIRNSQVIWISNGHDLNKNLQVSAQEFYKAVELEIIERQLPNVSLSRVTHSQSSIFSAKREYLRVARFEYVYDICAAPFGKGFFFSWWLGQTNKNIIARIPLINTLFGVNPNKKTLYQLDTESMFSASVNSCVQDAIAQMTATKGVRGLTDVKSSVHSN